MPRPRFFNLAAAFSTILFATIVIAWPSAGGADPWKKFVSLGSRFHASFSGRDENVRLVFFNLAVYGPCTGCTYSVSSPPLANGAPAPANPNAPHSFESGEERAGVYYRCVTWPNGLVLWTLEVSLFYPLVLSAFLPSFWIVRNFRRTPRGFPVLLAREEILHRAPGHPEVLRRI